MGVPKFIGPAQRVTGAGGIVNRPKPIWPDPVDHPARARLTHGFTPKGGELDHQPMTGNPTFGADPKRPGG